MHALEIQPRQSFPLTQEKSKPCGGGSLQAAPFPLATCTSDPAPSHVLQQGWRKLPSLPPPLLGNTTESWWAQDARDGPRALQRQAQNTRTHCSCMGRWGLCYGQSPFIAIFSLQNLPGSFSAPCRDTVAVIAAAAAAARRRLTNKLPINAALYQSWYQRFAARAGGAASAHTALGLPVEPSTSPASPSLPCFHSLPLWQGG